ncbi:MHYT domain-containing protein [Methylocapsa polymorpha]|uniref:MHYT domain-containing protein n=1 Tax=Methylocapsa polymorpha TaxID=3080828 RepID=A0ABZ0HW55_9HYPH|nr:MHYT domain-containing protein [Methylocapsa sp. RX1]
MPLIYDPSLVLLSLAVAIQGSYVSLRIALQIGGSHGLKRRLLLTGAAFSLAVAIWGMHFVGMLAARFPVAVNYLVLPTLLSFLVCVLVVGIALEAVSLGQRTHFTLIAAPIIMGGGIVTMHYIGMWALHESAHMSHNAFIVAVSILISVVASAVALWLTFDNVRRPSLFICATLLGLAISGMHYTAMAGTTFYPLPTAISPNSPAVSPALLAIVVAVVAFALSGVFLLTFVPEQSSKAPKPAAAPPTPQVELSLSTEAIPGSETGEEPRVESIAGVIALAPSPPLAAKTLPIEREGVKRSIRAEHIFAVHADAHYTFVFDGVDSIFCPLSIGEVEEQLAGEAFLRVHRSHLVNLDHVKCVRRAGDNAIAELIGSQPHTVPVSRTKFNELRALLKERAFRVGDELRA